MAEDLGSININVRDLGGGGGGGGGGGNVGGGPAMQRGAFNPAARLGARDSYPLGVGPYSPLQTQTMTSMTRQFAMLRERMATDWRINVEQWRRQTIRALGGNRSIQSAIPGATNLLGEVQQFMSRPGLMSAAAMAQQGSGTTRLLSALGMSSGAATGMLLGLGAVVGLTVGSIGMLRSAMEHTSKRIEETWRFSGTLANAKIQSDIAAMMATIREAQANGALYARAMRTKTQADVAWADTMIHFNKAASVGGSMYERMSRVVADTLRPFAVGAGGIAENNASGFEVGALFFAATIMQAFHIPLNGITKQLADIAAEQKAKRTGDNQWFKDDIRSMTGKEYGDI